MKIAIIGLGLIGSSMAYQLKNNGVYVKGFARRQKTIAKAYKYNIVNEASTDLSVMLKDADLIVLAVPVDAAIEYLKIIDKLIDWNVVVIDVGSIKQAVMNRVQKLSLQHIIFVGSHPMAGSEKQGIDNYIKSLFTDKPFVFCYQIGSDIEKIKKITKKFTELLEAKYIELSAEAHDQIVAGISHLPYILAVSLYKRFLKDRDRLTRLASTGFKDTTRVAHSDPAWGAMISKYNKENLIKEIDHIQEVLSTYKSLLIEQDDQKILDFLSNG